MNIENSYDPHHPWYYKRGGKTVNPSTIMEDVKRNEYLSYRARDIECADAKTEPQRSQKLRQIKQESLADLKNDLATYRKYVDDLRELRKANGLVDHSPDCLDLYVSLGLKYSHLYSNFAAILYADTVLNRQRDLFA